MRRTCVWGCLVAVATAACGADAERDVGETEGALGWDVQPSGRAVATNAASARGKAGVMVYHGGPLLFGTVRLYYIYYGDWSSSAAPSILEDFATHLGGSPYWNINTTYYDASATHVTNALALGGTTTDAYSHGKSLSDADVMSIVAGAIGSSSLPSDDTGVYFVLTSPDVAETSGFCTSYCGWHTHGTIGGKDVKYAFVGDPARCPSACEAQATSPNGDAGADGMASIIAHESDEAVTDPDLNAWYDRRGQENADKCAWTFGTTYTVANGSKANVRLGTRDYLIQQNWVNAGSGSCAMSY